MSRLRWAPTALLTTFGLLLLGRVVSERVTDRLWAASVGAATPLDALAELRVVLIALALVAGAVWSLGNLYLLARSVGAVQVPRQVGDLEIVTQVPGRYIVIAAFLLGLVLAGSLGWEARDWWMPRALWDAYRPVGIQEPVLGHDLGWYLFRLPWLRTLQRFALAQSGVLLGVVILSYALVGALRVRERTVVVSDLARVHVGGLLVAFALALFWGYQLEPAVHLAGLTGVPADSILTGVRIPVARLLSALALVAGGAAAVWMWAGRTAVVAVPWMVLAAASFVGHFVVPAVAAARGTPVPAMTDEVAQRQLGLAFDLPPERLITLPEPTRAVVEGTPVWDAFAVGFTLDRTLPGRPWEHFADPHLGVVAGRPVWLAVREIDLESARQADPRMTWEQVHGATYGRGNGVAAVDAVAVNARGLPRYFARLDAPATDSAQTLTDLAEGFWFSPVMADFVVTPADGELRGIPLGRWWRRLALAWSLQSPQLLARSRSPETLVLLERAVGRRLARYAPFARFGAAYPVLVRGRLVWLAAGYVWADAFPLVPAASWRGRQVRYLRMGFVGTVDAVSGATAAYLVPDADPLSRAWASLTEPLIHPAATMPPEVREALRYPEELFRVQTALAAQTLGANVHSTEPHPFVDGGVDGETPQLRMRTALEDDRLLVVLDGRMTAEGPQLQRLRLAESAGQFGTHPLARSLARGAAALAAIPGPLKLAVSPAGIVGVQTYYADPVAPGVPPWVAEVAAGWQGAAGWGPTLAEAAARVRPVGPERPAAADLLPALRAWFDRLDQARSAGDWDAFGQAWETLQALLADSVPATR